MRVLYNFLIHITFFVLRITQLFSKKFRAFFNGRKGIFKKLSQEISPNDKTIWFHCASLGEFEQGLPVMEAIRNSYSEYKIVVTFFSPSGYEIKKDTPVAHVTTYLPIDTAGNARRFLEIVNPDFAVFVKYEFWPNYLFELEKRNKPTLLISGLFRKGQSFFRPHGGFMRKALKTIDHFFVQDSSSEKLLQNINLSNVTVSGDTRFDRVSHQIEMDNRLNFMDSFCKDKLCVVCGSTWPEDEEILIDYINSSPEEVIFVIAPHKIERDKIESLQSKLNSPIILYSEIDSVEVTQAKVLIVNTIGLLTKIYSYANIAYVGGAMGSTGLHNILEPATFGVPIVIGQTFDKFPEAKRLQQLAGLFSVSNKDELNSIMDKLVSDDSFRTKTGMICGHFVNSNTGATQSIMDFIEELHRNGSI